jgi:hypothetical protein
LSQTRWMSAIFGKLQTRKLPKLKHTRHPFLEHPVGYPATTK